MTGTLRLLVLPVAFVAGLSACERTTPSRTEQASLANASQSGMVVSKDALQPKNEAQPVTEANTQAPAAPSSASEAATAQPSPSDFIAHYAALLQAHNFGEAYKLLDPSMGVTAQQFEKRLSGYKTIKADVGNIGPVEGAAGSLYDTVQLTLTGEKTDGTPYKVTVPVTLRRVNDVPGSTPEQRQWHIYKMDLSSNSKTQQP